MKKIVTYTLLLFSAIQLKAQQSATFKMKYLPDHKYTTDLTMGMDLNVNMTGNQAIIDKLTAQGITLPLALKLNVNLNGDITSGKKAADNSFPLMINLALGDLSVNIGGNVMNPLKGKNIGVKVYAHDTPDGKIQADSSFVNDKKDTAKTAMNGVLTSMQKQIKFPDHPLKVGESFTQEVPMNLPMTGKMGLSFTKTTVKTTYTLVSIAGGKANFDISQTMDLELTVKTAKATLTGDGTGKLVYGIADNYPLSLDDNLKMKLNVTAGTMVIDGSANLNINSKYTVN